MISAVSATGGELFVIEPNADAASVTDTISRVIASGMERSDGLDSDGDGLTDGEEMRITSGYGTVYVRKDSVNEIRAVVYKAKSDPTRADTDGDGYLDYGIKKDGDMADPHPFDSDVVIYKLRKADEFVEITDGIKVYYGADQDWFDETTDQTSTIYHKGCGIIAMLDFYLYMAYSDSKYVMTDILQFFPSFPSKIEKEEFMNWILAVTAEGGKFENKFSNSGDWCKKRTNLLHEQLISFVALGGKYDYENFDWFGIWGTELENWINQYYLG